MTKTQKRSRRVPIYRRPITIIIVALLVVGIAIAIFLLFRHNKIDEPTPPDPTPISKPTVDPDDFSDSEDPPEKTIQYEGENPNQLNELTGSITRRSIANGELTVVVSIDQYLTSDSSCSLVLKKTDSSASIDALPVNTLPVTTEATSSICGPFIVPVGQLSGTYTIDITITSPDKSGHITTDINI